MSMTGPTPALDPVAAVLEHLAALVSFDTRNPPRAIALDGIFTYLARKLERVGCDVVVSDLGDGCVNLYAKRGAPRILFNFHLDTVPAADGWTRDPLLLASEGGRAVGLGACDVKGAVAAMLVALEATPGDAALLFTSDEEAGQGRCVGEFLGDKPTFDGVVVAEPTGSRAVIAHRGIASVSGVFTGTAGHASSPRALADSALHELVRWAGAALALAAEEEARQIGGLAGVRFNLGILQGGKKSNMIADRAELRFGLRPRPGESPEALAARFTRLADPARASFQMTFSGAPLPAPGALPAAALRLADWLALPYGPPVDFWSEAALFSAAGYPALVFGPGDIAQAHAAGEWIAVDELVAAAVTYSRLLSQDRSAAG